MINCCLFVVGHDHGIDESEVHVDPSDNINVEETIRRAAVYLNRPGLIVNSIPRSQDIIDDYSPVWFPGTHPSVFPHGVGTRPKGVSEERWATGVINRYPVEQFARNTGFISDLFNVTQRHQVFTNAWLAFRFNPTDQAAINQLSNIQVQVMFYYLLFHMSVYIY
jgi:hypothetical protein